MINTHNFSLQYAYTVQQTGTCNENTRTYQMKILSWSNIKFFELIYKEMCSNKKGELRIKGVRDWCYSSCQERAMKEEICAPMRNPTPNLRILLGIESCSGNRDWTSCLSQLTSSPRVWMLKRKCQPIVNGSYIYLWGVYIIPVTLEKKKKKKKKR